MKEDIHEGLSKEEIRLELLKLNEEVNKNSYLIKNEAIFLYVYSTIIMVIYKYIKEKCINYPNIEPEDILSNLLVILLKKKNRLELKTKQLILWCFVKIDHIVNDEINIINNYRSINNNIIIHNNNPLTNLIRTECNLRYNNLLNIIKKTSILSNRDKKIIHLYYIKGLNIKCISKKLGISIKHISVILFRARNKIKTYYNKKYGRTNYL